MDIRMQCIGNICNLTINKIARIFYANCLESIDKAFVFKHFLWNQVVAPIYCGAMLIAPLS